MTYSYDPTALNENTAEGRKNIVRMWVGDTDQSQKQVTRRLEDEEIAYTLTRWSNQLLPAAVECGDILLARLARTEIGTVQNTQGQRYDQIKANVARLRDKMRGMIGFEVTGQSLSEKRAHEEDEDVVPSSFRRGQFDNRNAAQPDSPGTITSELDQED